MSAEELAAIRNQFNKDIQRFLIVEVAGAPVEGIETLIARHALRGADSIHLSTALWLGKATRTPIVFVASENELLNAASSNRIEMYNPATQAGLLTQHKKN
jgi:hypothetical protein